MNLAGIYLHIPFCRQSCHYCNFHFATSLRYKGEIVSAIEKEIALQKKYLANEPIETIYFGGGTPSLLTDEELHRLLRALNKNFTLVKDAEITLEANPDDMEEAKLLQWQQAGINRLSIGVQSFFDEDLQWMNRTHTAADALRCIKTAQKYFDNITIDLIYGLPEQQNDQWKKNVDTALALQIPHLSCYALTVEPQTPLAKKIKSHQFKDVDPDKQSEQFLLLMDWLDEAGYEHYEISNFAKGQNIWRSRHNASYWQGKKYLGLGPSAHSYNGNERQWNIANNQQYMVAIQKNEIPFTKEVLTDTQKINEYIMTSLRTIEGIQLENSLFDEKIKKEELIAKSKKFINGGLLIIKNESLQLTNAGKLLADGIASELFF